MATGVLAPAPMFIKRGKHELDKLLKKVQKARDEAVDHLVNEMNSDTADPKLRHDAAKMLISYEIEISKIINTEQLTRSIAEFKAGGLKPSLEQEDDGMPRLEMDTIQDV